MSARSYHAALRESPLPLLVLLALLLAFIEYLHWTVTRSENLPHVVVVPTVPPAPDGNEGDDSAEDVLARGAPATEVLASSGNTAGPLHEQARRLAVEGRTAEALAHLDASLATEGRSDPARLHQPGILLLALRRDREALADLTKASAGLAGSGKAKAFYNLGLARSRTGDGAGAEAAYRAALQANPNFDEAWNNLGLVLDRRGDRAGAIEALRRAADLAGAASRPRALTNLAEVLAHAGREAEAVALLDPRAGRMLDVLGFERRVTVRFLREGRMQSLLIIVGVAAGVAVVAYISALISGLQSNTLEKTLGAQAHVTLRALDDVVTPALAPVPGTDVRAQTQPRAQRPRSIGNWQAMVPLLEALPAVAAVSPMVSGAGLAVRGEATKSIALMGVDLDRYDRIVHLRAKAIAGQARLGPGESVIGRELADDLGLRVGDRFSLVTGTVTESLRVTALVDLGVRDLNHGIC